MSRFSRAEAEANGWVFVHQSEESVDFLAPTQGRFQHNLPLLRAEKYVSLPGRGSTLVNESAESEGKLLEQISLFEAQLESKGFVYDQDTGAYTSKLTEAFESQPETTTKVTFVQGDDAENVEGVGEPANTVIVSTDPENTSLDAPTATVSEADFAARDRADVLIVADEDADSGARQVFQGGSPEEASAGYEAKLASESALENRRTAEADVGDTKQVVLDPAAVSLDSPGATGTGTVIVREGEGSPAEVVERRQAEAIEKEQARPEIPSDVEPPEDAPLLAGTDVGIQERGDLGSEIPGADSLDQTPDDYEPAGTEGPTAEAAAEEQQAREDAIVESRDEKLEGDNPASAFGAEAQTEALLAASDAVQEQAGDESESDAPADSAQENVEESQDESEKLTPAQEVAQEQQVEATEPAKALAQEKGVDLSQVEGTGKQGRVTKPDVESAIEASGAGNDEPFDAGENDPALD